MWFIWIMWVIVGNRYYRYDYLVDGQRKYVGFRI